METDPPENKEISFGLLADLQYCDADPAYNRYFRKTPEKLNKALKEFDQHRLDFVLNLGDTIDRKWESFDGILPLLSNIKLPLYTVLGNHDYEVAQNYKSKVPNKLGTQKYYDFSIRNWRFIVLDGNEISTFANEENSENYQEAEKLFSEKNKKINANFWNGGIGKKQLSWLKKTLGTASEKQEKVMIFCHYPIFPVHRHNLLNDTEILKIIEKYPCVKAWINGHNHDGNYGQHQNIHFINMKGMVETKHEFAFAVVTLTEDHILIKGYGMECSARLHFK